MPGSSQKGEFLMVRALLLVVILLLMLLVPMWIKKSGEKASEAPRQKTAEKPVPASPKPPAAAPVEPAAVAVQPVADPAPQAGPRHGLTFALAPAASPPGVVHLSCHGRPDALDQPHEKSCNPYRGDTSCQTVLPVLCISGGGAPKPPGVQSNFYEGWTGATLSATEPVMGAVLSSQAAASQRCSRELGSGWRMAEFHDGNGGWGLRGLAGIGLGGSTRYWVHINDQPGNCWDSRS